MVRIPKLTSRSNIIPVSTSADDFVKIDKVNDNPKTERKIFVNHYHLIKICI
jgi:hypothetical protein